MTKENLTQRQYGTLVWIYEHQVEEEHLRGIFQVTLWSLLHSRLIARQITKGGKEIIIVTENGVELMNRYRRPQPSVRKHESEISARVQRLLTHVRVLQKAS